MAASKKNSKQPTKKTTTVGEELNESYDPTVLHVTRDEVEECFKFFDFFKVPLDPTLQAMRVKLDAGGVLTLQDQHDLGKILAADISKASHHIFHDPVFREVRLEIASVLVEIVKAEVAQALSWVKKAVTKKS